MNQGQVFEQVSRNMKKLRGFYGKEFTASEVGLGGGDMLPLETIGIVRCVARRTFIVPRGKKGIALKSQITGKYFYDLKEIPYHMHARDLEVVDVETITVKFFEMTMPYERFINIQFM